MEFINPQTELIYLALKEKYNKVSLTKKELRDELGLSRSTLDLYMSKGIGIPNYKKLGDSKQSKVIFNIIDVAEYLANTIKTA